MESLKDWVDGLYLQYSPKMVSTAMRAGFTAEEAEDLTQEVFLLFLTKAPMVRENYRSPGGYLFVTLRNLMGDALRQRRRRKTLSYGEVPDSGKDDVYFTSLRDALPSELIEGKKNFPAEETKAPAETTLDIGGDLNASR